MNISHFRFDPNTKVFFLLLLVAGLVSCNIEKRHYRSGLNVEWNAGNSSGASLGKKKPELAIRNKGNKALTGTDEPDVASQMEDSDNVQACKSIPWKSGRIEKENFENELLNADSTTKNKGKKDLDLGYPGPSPKEKPKKLEDRNTSNKKKIPGGLLFLAFLIIGLLIIVINPDLVGTAIGIVLFGLLIAFIASLRNRKNAGADKNQPPETEKKPARKQKSTGTKIFLTLLVALGLILLIGVLAIVIWFARSPGK